MFFAGIYLLDYMINTPHSFSVFLDGNDQDLEPILEWLMARDYIEIKNKEKYIPAKKGREALEKFMARYSEYLTMFDIFCAVDLEEGEFAFSSYYDFEDDESWKQYLDAEKWDDLRIAVADYKNMNPVEIVFMSFINENRFGRDESGWQFDLLLGSVWDEILKICETAIKWEDLGYKDDKGVVSSEDVTEDVICQGTEIMLELLEEEDEFIQYDNLNWYEDDEVESERYVDEVGIPNYPKSHYFKYRNPNYVSPVWKH